MTSVQWQGSSDSNGLPLSNKYRGSLRKLCEILSSGNPLPQHFEVDRSEIESLCTKLKSDDAIGGGDVLEEMGGKSSGNFSSMLAFVVVVFYVLYLYRRQIEDFCRSLTRAATSSSSSSSSSSPMASLSSSFASSSFRKSVSPTAPSNRSEEERQVAREARARAAALRFERSKEENKVC
jgi:hypothetical protein